MTNEFVTFNEAVMLSLEILTGCGALCVGGSMQVVVGGRCYAGGGCVGGR